MLCRRIEATLIQLTKGALCGGRTHQPCRAPHDDQCTYDTAAELSGRVAIYQPLVATCTPVQHRVKRRADDEMLLLVRFNALLCGLFTRCRISVSQTHKHAANQQHECRRDHEERQDIDESGLIELDQEHLYHRKRHHEARATAPSHPRETTVAEAECPLNEIASRPHQKDAPRDFQVGIGRTPAIWHEPGV